MAVLLAGWPTSVPGATVNRLCGSSLEAAIQGARAIETGDASIVVVGGGEAMSRSPWILQKASRAFPAGNETLYSSALGWRMVNPKMPSQWTISLGESTEKLVAMHGITREQQDEFALRSHQLAARAYAEDALKEVVPVPDIELTQDESIRADTSLEKLATLEPAFVQGGTVTAGNASPLNDGAAALLLADEPSAGRAGLDRVPLARISLGPLTASTPTCSGSDRSGGQHGVARAGLTWDDIDVVELNEAFAGQSLACLKSWPSLIPRRSTSAAARSPSDTRSERQARGSSAVWRMSCTTAVAATASPPSASASDRASPSCSKVAERRFASAAGLPAPAAVAVAQASVAGVALAGVALAGVALAGPPCSHALVAQPPWPWPSVLVAPVAPALIELEPDGLAPAEPDEDQFETPPPDWPALAVCAVFAPATPGPPPCMMPVDWLP